MKKSVRILASLLVAVSLLAVSAVAADIFLGDTNGDGKVNNLDATNVLKYDAGINDSIENGDYNEDGTVNNLDAAAILKYDAGIVEENTNVSAKYVRYIPDEYMPIEPHGFAQSKFVIHSVEELRAYLGERHELYDYGYELNIPEPSEPFDAYEEYDEEYFENNILVLVLVEEGSGSIRRRVDSVTKQNGGIDISIEVFSPELITADMAYWTLFIELEKSYDVAPEKINLKRYEGVSAKYTPYIPDEYMPVDHPYGFAQSIFVIHSVEELRAYLGERHELYDYGYRLDAPEPVIPFYPYYEYDEEYFKDNILLLLLIEEPSGSIRNRVKSVTKNGEELDVLIECYSPAMRTDDMAYWTLFIELDKSYDVTPDKINVNTNIIDIDNTVDA